MRDAIAIAAYRFVRTADAAAPGVVIAATLTDRTGAVSAPSNPFQQESADMLRKSLLAAAVAGLALGTLVPATPAQSAVGLKAGLLTCHVGHGYGFVFGSSRDLNCTFTENGRAEDYTGNIAKFGVDIGYLKNGVIVWAVLAPTTSLAPGALSGEYGEVTAGASVAVGGSANVLIGGSTREISLQPISIEGDTGLNVAAGIAAISLKPAA